MQATGFNRLVRIEQRVTAGDGFTWSLFKKAWAKKLTGPGREYMASGQVLASTDARFIMPWFSGVNPTMRLVDGSEVFNIVNVSTDDETGIEYLELRVAGGTNPG